jgi:hypothetical protein
VINEDGTVDVTCVKLLSPDLTYGTEKNHYERVFRAESRTRAFSGIKQDSQESTIFVYQILNQRCVRSPVYTTSFTTSHINY